MEFENLSVWKCENEDQGLSDALFFGEDSKSNIKRDPTWNSKQRLAISDQFSVVLSCSGDNKLIEDSHRITDLLILNGII